MPASKKDLRAQKQKKNVAAGIGDEKGRIASHVKEPQVMAACTICKQQIRMIKKNEQARVHVESKHSGKAFDVCFPGFTCT
jgi:ribosomal protein L34E